MRRQTRFSAAVACVARVSSMKMRLAFLSKISIKNDKFKNSRRTYEIQSPAAVFFFADHKLCLVAYMPNNGTSS